MIAHSRVQHQTLPSGVGRPDRMQERAPILRSTVPGIVPGGTFGRQIHASGIVASGVLHWSSSVGLRSHPSMTVPAGRLEVPLSSLELEQAATVTNAKSRASGRMVQSVTPRRSR